MDVVFKICEICLFPLLVALTGFAIRWIKIKTDNLKVQTKDETINKYIDQISNIVTMCVIKTNQTYVDTLKAKGTFNADAQREAFENTYYAVTDLLSDELNDFIEASYGDVENYLTTLIEAKVNELK